MDKDSRREQVPQYKPEAWKDDEFDFCSEETPTRPQPSPGDPGVREQCRLLDLLGRINYRILSGNRVYVEVGGVVYKTLYGGYWRSVFTGIEHYLLRCEQVSGGAWSENSSENTPVDLPIAYSNDGWTASGHSLSFILNRDLAEDHSIIHRLRRLHRFKNNIRQKQYSL